MIEPFAIQTPCSQCHWSWEQPFGATSSHSPASLYLTVRIEPVCLWMCFHRRIRLELIRGFDVRDQLEWSAADWRTGSHERRFRIEQSSSRCGARLQVRLWLDRSLLAESFVPDRQSAFDSQGRFIEPETPRSLSEDTLLEQSRELEILLYRPGESPRR
jgi:hypothetical protein